ncbi:MAG: hypothetical protein H6R07_352 [Proteobacteria bacterium]|nr:hypothetical protein [Pseudomonadota bacterium]
MKMGVKLHKQAGFSLVELLVALIISFLIMFAALGSASFYEANRRNTIGGNTALENAMASVANIQKDARMAGLGITGSNGIATCSTINVYYNGTTTNATAYSAVSITKGADDQTSDQITFAYSDPIGTVPVSTLVCKNRNKDNQDVCDDTNANGPPAASSDIPVLSTVGFTASQVAMLVPPPDLKPAPDKVPLPCTVVGITAVQDASSRIQIHPTNNCNVQDKDPACWNPPNAGPFTKLTGICNDGTTDCNNNTKNIPPGTRLMTTGPIRWVTYRINDQQEFEKIEQTGSAAGLTSVIAENVVMLRVQYGLSASASSSKIIKWSNTAADQSTVKAIRVVVVGRSPQRVKDKNAAGTCTATTAAPTHGLIVTEGQDDSIAIDLSSNPDWRCFYYKTTSMTVPLKNILMQTSSPN